ncbi:dabb-domain-containing protein [Rhizopogon salebrosus TDB-379]|nr:dabb-domain-containing protein [Rhizopogon salebrosus TDB-379]
MTIHHIVLLKFKPETTPEQRQSTRDSVEALPSKIPAIQSLITGKTVGHGYDAGVIFVFESVDKLNEYQSHKAHTDHRAFAAPYLEGTDVLIVDIESA